MTANKKDKQNEDKLLQDSPFQLSKESSQRLFSCQHILDSILCYADPATQVGCMRANYPLFLAAGRALYHTVAINGDNMASFLLGSRSGADADEMTDCPFLAGSPVRCRKHMKKEEDEEDEEEEEESEPSLIGNSELNKVEASLATTEDGEEASPSFKETLLSFVRVLTVGSHHACVCHTYEEAAELFTGLDILRIVPDSIDIFTLALTCDGNMHPCPFFTNLWPRKIVLRNMDVYGAPVPPHGESEWEVPTVEEVVYVFPTDGRAYNDGAGFMLLGLGDLFPNAKSFKIVFYSHWESWDNSHSFTIALCGDPRLDPDMVVYPISSIAHYQDTQYTVCGLESLSLSDNGDIAGTFQRFYPRVQLDRPRLVQLIRDELRTSALQIALTEDVLESPDFSEHIQYQSMDEYLADTEGRRGEINADD